MPIWIRRVLVWLLALALPAQAMANVAMAHCGPSHERMQAVAVSAHHHPGDDDAVHGASHHHEAADASAPHSHDTAEPDKLTDLGQYKCSSCASCCSGCALLSAMPAVPEPDRAPAVFVAEVVGIDAFASDGPDRPPRPYLA